jgi:hypothetical protein
MSGSAAIRARLDRSWLSRWVVCHVGEQPEVNRRSDVDITTPSPLAVTATTHGKVSVVFASIVRASATSAVLRGWTIARWRQTRIDAPV